MSEAAAAELQPKPKREARQLAIAPQPPTVMTLIQLAVDRGADITTLERLLDLKMRVEADEARKAFEVAFAAFKSEAVRIVKNVAYTDGPLKGKKRADLFGIVDAVTPALSKHGLSMSWSLTKDSVEWMEVTCWLRHEQGHSEHVSMGGAPDTGPGRNALQARGSTKTYLEKYTSTAILGMASQDQDTDGASAWEPLDAAIEELKSACNSEVLSEIYGRWFKQGIKEKAFDAMKVLCKAKDERRAVLLKDEPAQ